MMDPEMLKTLGGVVWEVIRTLGTAIIAGFVAFWAARRQLEVEKLKIHEKDRTLAHKKLFIFAQHLEDETFPMAECKRLEFIRIMDGEYLGSLQMEAVYFSEEINKTLDQFRGMYSCTTRGELGPETEDEVTRFLEEEVFEDARKLAVLARKAILP